MLSVRSFYYKPSDVIFSSANIVEFDKVPKFRFHLYVNLQRIDFLNSSQSWILLNIPFNYLGKLNIVKGLHSENREKLLSDS